MKWKPFSPFVTAVLAILAGLILQHRHNTELAIARADTQRAVEIATLAVNVTHQTLAYADSIARHADSVEAQASATADQAAIAASWAAHQHARADSAAAVAPDTCAPALAAMRASRDAEHTSAELWQSAYEKQRQAAAELRTAGDTLANTARDLSVATEGLASSATTLVKASGPSFWSHLKPDLVVSVGATRTFDGRVVAGVQAGLGWRIPL